MPFIGSTNMTPLISFLLFSFVSIVSFSQTGNLSQRSGWKSKFPEKEFVVGGDHTIVNFILNNSNKSLCN